MAAARREFGITALAFVTIPAVRTAARSDSEILKGATAAGWPSSI